MKLEQFMNLDLVQWMGKMAQLIQKPDQEGLFMMPAIGVDDLGAGPGKSIPFTQAEADQVSHLYRALPQKKKDGPEKTTT